MVRTLNTRIVHDEAIKISGTNGLSINSVIKTILSLGYGFEGDVLNTRTCSAFQQYKRSGRINQYASRQSNGRFKIGEKREYKAISDIMDFMYNDIKTRDSPRKIDENFLRTEQDSIPRVSKSKRYRLKLQPSPNTEYGQFVLNYMMKAYRDNREDLSHLDLETQAKVNLVDTSTVRSFSKKIEDKFRVELTKEEHITPKGNIWNPLSKRVIIDTIGEEVGNLPLELIKERRRTGIDGRKLRKKNSSSSDMEDDSDYAKGLEDEIGVAEYAW